VIIIGNYNEKQQPEWQYVKQSKYSPKDIFQRLIHVDLENSSIEDICNDW
jgi:hypothetical protein